MDDQKIADLESELLAAAESAGDQGQLLPLTHLPAELSADSLFTVSLVSGRVEILTPTAAGTPPAPLRRFLGALSGASADPGSGSTAAGGKQASGAAGAPGESAAGSMTPAAGATSSESAALPGSPGFLLERFRARLAQGGQLRALRLAGGATDLAYLLLLPPQKRAVTTTDPVDLLAGRALLQESALEAATGESWLLLRCERIGAVSPEEARRLAGEAPERPALYPLGKERRLSAEQVDSLSREVASRARRLYGDPGVEGPKRYLAFLYRGTQGGGAGSLRSDRFLLLLPFARKRVEGPQAFRALLEATLAGVADVDPEAGLAWLRLLAPRRYQYLRPGPSLRAVYNAVVGSVVGGTRAVSAGGAGTDSQRLFQELRRDRAAFAAYGAFLAEAPRFVVEDRLAALSPAQRELLLPRVRRRNDAPEDRLFGLLDSLRKIEGYIEANPSTTARPLIEPFRRVARERYRRLRRRVEASVEAGIFSLLFEHARLGWLQRAWSRVPRSDMVRLLAFEQPKVAERAGMLYSRRGRQLLREDAEALALRTREWEPSLVVSIAEARRRLWPLLLEQLFDAESRERYLAALLEGSAGKGLPAALCALTVLRLEEVEPGTVGPARRIPAAARVAAEPALDEESRESLVRLSEDATLLKQGGSRFVWLLAHALERLGRPEQAAEALAVILKQRSRRGEEMSDEERRRTRKLARKYKDLTS